MCAGCLVPTRISRGSGRDPRRDEFQRRLAVGGTNKTSWMHGAIPFVDRTAKVNGAFAETVNLSWDANASKRQLGGSFYSNHSIATDLADNDGLFSITGMIHVYAAPHVVQIGASPSANTLPVAVDLRVLGRTWFGSNLHISTETESNDFHDKLDIRRS